MEGESGLKDFLLTDSSRVFFYSIKISPEKFIEPAEVLMAGYGPEMNDHYTPGRI